MTAQSAAPRRRGMLYICAAATAWGTGGAVATLLFRTSGLGPVAVSFWRFAIAFALLAVRQRGRPARRPADGSRAGAGLTGAALAVYLTAYFGAVQNAGLALGTLVTLGAAPVLIAVAGHYLIGERVTGRRAVAIGVALAGLLLLVAGPAAGPHPVRGVALALLSALGYTAITVSGRRGGGTGATAGVLGVGTVCLLPFAAVAGVWPRAGHALATTGWLLFLGAVPTMLAYRWYFAGIATVPGATASVIVLLEPAIATLLAVGLLGEPLTAPVLAGAGLLLAAIAILGRDSA